MSPKGQYDGRTFPGRRVIELYGPDANDSNEHFVAVVLHEYFHGLYSNLKITGYSCIEQEEMADNFAHAFSYEGVHWPTQCEGNPTTKVSWEGARFACSVLAKHGADICPDEIG